MSQVRVLTPAGTGAIAVLAITGPDAYAIVRPLFTPANKKPLPPEAHRGFRFGNIGGNTGDEVILAIESSQWVEIHCHGGHQVVQWLLNLFAQQGCEIIHDRPKRTPWDLLPFAKTVRCASIILDQMSLPPEPTALMQEEWQRNSALGQHLITPWQVVIAGQPNAGKSSLLNALAGYARSVVSAIPGTTRDTVTTEVAFDGWPIALTDTAGLRETTDSLEHEGVNRATAMLRTADFVVWLIDLAEDTETQLAMIPDDIWAKVIIAANKVDAHAGKTLPGIGISATTGLGLAELIQAIVTKLVPYPPEPGEAVPLPLER